MLTIGFSFNNALEKTHTFWRCKLEKKTLLRQNITVHSLQHCTLAKACWQNVGGKKMLNWVCSYILPLQQDIYLRWGDEGGDTKTHTAQEVTAPVGKIKQQAGFENVTMIFISVNPT